MMYSQLNKSEKCSVKALEQWSNPTTRAVILRALNDPELLQMKSDGMSGDKNQMYQHYGDLHPKFTGTIVGTNKSGTIEVHLQGTKAIQDAGYHSGHVYACCRGDRSSHRKMYWHRLPYNKEEEGIIQ